MAQKDQKEKLLVQKLRSLSPEKAAAVEDFIDFLAQRDERRLTQAAAALSEQALAEVWDNSKDAVYDRL